MARATVSPPTPESNTPIGAADVPTSAVLTHRGYPVAGHRVRRQSVDCVAGRLAPPPMPRTRPPTPRTDVPATKRHVLRAGRPTAFHPRAAAIPPPRRAAPYCD